MNTAHHFTVYDALARNAEVHGGRLALVDEKGTARTFAELRQRVDRLATGLARAGLEPGARLSILALNSGAYIETYLACARQGLVACPINWRLTADEVAKIVERARPQAFLADRPARDRLPQGPAADGIRLWIDLDSSDSPAGHLPIAELYSDGDLAPPPAVDPDAPFAVIATAAVDTVPRGAILSHSNLIAANLQEIGALSLTPDDRNLVALPLFHIAALGRFLAFLHVGAANVVIPKFDPALTVSLIDRFRLTHLSNFPPVLSQVLDAAKAAGSRLASLRLVTGLESPETITRLHDETRATFWTGFGQAETTGLVTLQNARERLGCAGKAGELCRVKLADDYDRDVAPGGEGEILVRGPLVFLGYDGLPEVTAHTQRNGWHHTGDVGRFDGAGNLTFVRRKAEKELIKPGGENVYPAEVEAVIAELEGVDDACVFGVPDARWGEAVRAVVAVRAGTRLEPQQVIDHVGSRIARFKRPQEVVITESLPRTEHGDLDRVAVKKRWS